MSEILYINPNNGLKYGIKPDKVDQVSSDWIECQKNDDGTYADDYNLDGTPVPPAGPTIEDIQNEAGKRIIAICPEWKQRNYIATDLTYTKIIQDGGTLTSEQQDLRIEMESTWESIQNIRSKSNDLEVMSPIPQDFKNDSYWE